MSERSYGPMLPNAPQTESAKHTGKNLSGTARTAAFKVGQLVQVENDAALADAANGLVVADVTAGANTEIAVIDSFPIGGDVNKFVEGSTTERRPCILNVVRGRGRRCKAMVRAVGSDIAEGTPLQPSNATSYVSLRNSASTTVTNVLSRVVTGGAGKSFAIALEAATVAETTTAGADKLIMIEILSD